MINPLGFSLEKFDASGAIRATENDAVSANVGSVNFDATARGQISGRLARISATTTGQVYPGVTVTLRCGAQFWSARTNVFAIFQFDHLPLGTFEMLPAMKGTYWSR